MSVLSLARFQFAMTTIFHFFFVPFSIGTIVVVAIMESCYVHTGDETYKKMTKFWGGIFLLSFAVGVVTGIIQEFQFGMNWSDYSRFMGDIFGAPLAFEALLSFFIESTFIGLWMFTWNRVGKKLHLFFVWMIVFGTVTSSLWILTANSFMQHPVGFAIRHGRAEMTNFWALLGNPQLRLELGHVLVGALMTGGVIIAGLAAWQLLKQRKWNGVAKEFYRKTMKISLILALIGSVSTMVIGDSQMVDLNKAQPMKFAAMEALYQDTGEHGQWTAVGFSDPKTHELKYNIDIPDMLTILTYHKATGKVYGMKHANKVMRQKYGVKNSYYPPVNTLFWSFRVMCGISAWVALFSIIGLFAVRKKDPWILRKRWLQWVLAITTFFPFLANTAGWLIAELGRYPFTVYGMFTIADSVSPNVSATSLLISNIVYFCLFATLAVVMIGLVRRQLHAGPDFEGDDQYKGHKPYGYDPFSKEAF